MGIRNALHLHKFGYLLLVLLIASCGAVKKKTTYGKTSKKRTVSVAPSKEVSLTRAPRTRKERPTALSPADNIINTALTFSGTRYKYGGTTKKGMDCSGLLYVSFGEHDVQLPRVSYNMAEKGKRVRINKVEKGDLLFFKTKKQARRINHVGMVVSVKGDEVKFIHASSSRGVIVSSLREGFWNNAFVKATRVL
ncbi:NlpC/P60 family protein [Maribacter algarum]|uniref:NlpC/P60 family protein n=1 Tax=Maribacter algarum (ex Zhang et al. 2020) TaxID=2578118 RepID=A0A5S3PX12_9FLAO|nr:C40 family peptidase [Maribacter algarum]TMM59481.1 NlpC/P60 family protein [Maribacter algarum]